MTKRLFPLAITLTLLAAGVAGAQHPILDDGRQTRSSQKYQQASCEQLWEQKGKPKIARTSRR